MKKILVISFSIVIALILVAGTGAILQTTVVNNHQLEQSK